MKFKYFACLWANRGTKNVPLRLSLELVVVGDYITHTHTHTHTHVMAPRTVTSLLSGP
jgi:hypothetical protein